MRRIVIPAAWRHTARRADRRLIVEIVDVHHGDVAMRPVEGAEIKSRADGNACAPEKSRAESRTRVIAGPGGPVHRRISRIPPRTVDDRGVVVRHIHHLRIGLLDDDGLALRLDAHDFIGLKVARRLRFLAQSLDRVHHLLLLRKKCVAQPLHPVELLVHHGDDLRKRDQRLDAGIPTLLFDGPHRRIAAQAWIGSRPACRLHDFDRIRRGHQDLREQ